jgi:hypothetical protein
MESLVVDLETCTAGLSPTRSVAPSTHVISLSSTRSVAPYTHVIHYDQRPGFPYINLAYHHRRPHPLSSPCFCLLLLVYDFWSCLGNFITGVNSAKQQTLIDSLTLLLEIRVVNEQTTIYII